MIPVVLSFCVKNPREQLGRVLCVRTAALSVPVRVAGEGPRRSTSQGRKKAKSLSTTLAFRLQCSNAQDRWLLRSYSGFLSGRTSNRAVRSHFDRCLAPFHLANGRQILPFDYTVAPSSRTTLSPLRLLQPPPPRHSPRSAHAPLLEPSSP